jgi:hypothetical protein
MQISSLPSCRHTDTPLHPSALHRCCGYSDPEGWWSGWRVRATRGNVSVKAFSKCMALPGTQAQQQCLACAQAVKVSPLEQMLHAISEEGTRVDACAQCFDTVDSIKWVSNWGWSAACVTRL